MKVFSLVWSICTLFVLFVCSHVHGQTTEANLETLKLVQLIFRHGDRNPEYPYPTDLYDESAWPEGWAQLTDEGKQDEYKLGQYLRTRYGNFLNSTYVPNQIYTMSSDTDRTIMSAMLVLAGLYPTNNESSWDNQVNWQPIPLRTVFEKDDNFIRTNLKCPRYEQLFNDLLVNSEPFKQINIDNKELYEMLSKNSGVNITNVNDIDRFYATLFVEDLKGMKIPEWAQGLKTDTNFQYLYNISYQASTFTPELKRVRIGMLVKFLVENVNERVENATSTRKMIALSGHDRTLMDLMNTLGVYDLIRPFYSSVLMVELHENPTGNYYIELHYRNDTDREPYKLSMPECDLHFECPLTKFVTFTKPYIPEDWVEECKVSQPELVYEESNFFTYLIVGVVVGAVVGFLIYVIYMSLQKKRRNVVQKHQYQSLY